MKFWSITDKGIVRQQNEDVCRVYVSEEKEAAVCLVCDGMGGARAGSVASATAAELFMEDIEVKLDFLNTQEEMAEAIKQAVDLANIGVYQKASSDRELSGMGTTMVGTVVSGENALVLNIGDSRAYHITEDGIFKITRDHSVVEDMIDRGDITREEARCHPSKNLITRAVGTDTSVLCDLYTVHLQPEEFVLLCTDGLTNVISEQEILYEVLHGENLDTCCQRMLEIVISRGAPDNVTIVLLQR